MPLIQYTQQYRLYIQYMLTSYSCTALQRLQLLAAGTCFGGAGSEMRWT